MPVATTRPAPYAHVCRVKVFLWGEPMGSVTLDPARGCCAFTYTQAFRRMGIEPAPLHMPTSGVSVTACAGTPLSAKYRLTSAVPKSSGSASLSSAGSCW